jgi:hypothetical protein
LKDSDLNTVIFDDSFAIATAMAGLADGRFVVAANNNLYVKGTDLQTQHLDEGFGAVTAIAGLTDGNFVVASTDNGGSLRVKLPDLSATLYSDLGFGAATAMAGLADGSFIVASTDNGGSLRIKSLDLSATLYSDLGFGSVAAIAGLADGNILIARDDGTLFLKNSDLSQTLLMDESWVDFEETITALAAWPLPITSPDIPGDHNADGSVDAADYVYWRKTGIDGQQGYDDWRANFGEPGTGGSGTVGVWAVPEPSACVLVLVALLGLDAVRRPNAKRW